MKMNLIPCSRATVALLCIVGLLAGAGTAGALSVSTADTVPTETAVGSEVSMTYVIEDPFTDVPSQWTLAGETELENVNWVVTVYRADREKSESQYDDQSFTQDLDIDNNGDRVEVKLVGVVPTVGNYTYASEETYTVGALTRVSGNNENEFRNDSVHHYTEDSQAARKAIDAAGTAIETTGGNSDAEALRRNAISAYDSGNFANAIDLATQAENTAKQAQQSQQTTQTLLYVAAAVVLLLLLGGGGFYIYSQSQSDDYSKL